MFEEVADARLASRFIERPHANVQAHAYRTDGGHGRADQGQAVGQLELFAVLKVQAGLPFDRPFDKLKTRLRMTGSAGLPFDRLRMTGSAE